MMTSTSLTFVFSKFQAFSSRKLNCFRSVLDFSARPRASFKDSESKSIAISLVSDSFCVFQLARSQASPEGIETIFCFHGVK